MRFDLPFGLSFDPESGYCRSDGIRPLARRVSDLADYFQDREAAARAVKNGDPVLYEYYSLDLPEREGVLQFGTTILYPGCIGREYAMTKGHFHRVLDTAEVYYTLRGEGRMVLETPEGETDVQPLTPERAFYVPGRWAHRSVNVGDEPLVMLFVYPAHAGHDYGTIAEKGFRKLILRGENGEAVVADNPNRKGW
ncbi:MAG: glucose-6-phosphate isomerase family protein [Candidatus Onthomonas sp.]